MFLAIDTLILERIFTPVAWWFERKTGQTNFRLAWWCLAVNVLALFFIADIDLVVLHSKDFWFAAICGILTAGAVLRMLAAGFQDEIESTRPGLVRRLLRDASDVYLRLCMLFIVLPLSVCDAIKSFFQDGWSAMTWGVICWIMWSLSYASALYVCDVRRPPPRPWREEVPESGLVPIQVRN